jgi:DNA invertase Pin-like site-specific DNA recombinase
MTHLKAVIYARVSTDDQSCDRQLSELSEWAARMQWAIVGTFTEKQSGAKTDRRERARVIDLARRGLCDVVLVLELTRWSRSTVDLLATLEELAGYGVAVKALNGINLDISTPHGKLITGILGTISEFERELTVQRVRSGLANARARGVTLGRRKGQCPKLDRLGARVVSLKNNGLSIRRIARELGISPTTVQKALKQG